MDEITKALAYKSIDENIEDTTARQIVRYVMECEIWGQDTISPTNQYLSKKYNWSSGTTRVAISLAKRSQFITTTGRGRNRCLELNVGFLKGKMAEIRQKQPLKNNLLDDIGKDLGIISPNNSPNELPNNLPNTLPNKLPNKQKEKKGLTKRQNRKTGRDNNNSNNNTNIYIPTQEEVIKYFEEKGYQKSIAVKAFDYYDANDWKDANGKKVKSWKQKMIGVWFKPENKENKPKHKPNQLHR